MTAAFTEADLARHVVTWLDGFTVYQEVEYDGSVADIVVDVGGFGWIIETKLSLGMSVLEQAENWIRAGVKRVSVAVPKTKSMRSRRFANRIADWIGCGIIEVSESGYVREAEAATFHRVKRKPWSREPNDILKACKEQHKTFCAAGSQSGRWTPYKETCSRILRIVQQRPGLCLKDLMDELKGEHHYKTESTARSCLPRWIRTGKVPGVTSRKNGKRLEIFPI